MDKTVDRVKIGSDWLKPAHTLDIIEYGQELALFPESVSVFA